MLPSIVLAHTHMRTLIWMCVSCSRGNFSFSLSYSFNYSSFSLATASFVQSLINEVRVSLLIDPWSASWPLTPDIAIDRGQLICAFSIIKKSTSMSASSWFGKTKLIKFQCRLGNSNKAKSNANFVIMRRNFDLSHFRSPFGIIAVDQASCNE